MLKINLLTVYHIQLKFIFNIISNDDGFKDIMYSFEWKILSFFFQNLHIYYVIFFKIFISIMLLHFNNIFVYRYM